MQITLQLSLFTIGLITITAQGRTSSKQGEVTSTDHGFKSFYIIFFFGGGEELEMLGKVITLFRFAGENL